MQTKRFLLRYEGPIEEFVGTVNAKKVIFHRIKIKDEIHKVGEVYDQNAFNYILKDPHLTPYVPCIEALKQLNKLQEQREKKLADAAEAERKRRMKSRILSIANEIQFADEQIAGYTAAINDLKESKKALALKAKEIEAEITPKKKESSK